MMWIKRITITVTMLPAIGIMIIPSLIAQEQGNVQSKEQSMLDRIMHPDRSRQSAYQGKEFNSKGSPYDKTFASKDYSGARNFGSHSYETKGFASGMKGWLGDHLFPKKKLSGNLEKANPDADKKFDSKDFKTKNFAELDKTSPYSSKGDFPTKSISLKGKTQGAIDNNPQLEAAIRKGLSIDDVRKLLNKGP
jgi:hypothetical protein